MAAVRCLLASTAAVCLWAAGVERRRAPSYTAANVVNAASNAEGALAPYTLATIYGADLAYSTRAAARDDLRGDVLPDVLDGVRVIVDGQAAPLYFVSPRQVNFLVPYITGGTFPTEVNLTVVVNALAGPAVKLKLNATAPAFFQRDSETVVAVHADWSLISSESPARPGEEIVLFATGLGRTTPPVAYPHLPSEPFRVQASVTLAGTPLEPDRLGYTGVTPGFAGLYQINLKLPEEVAKDPEVRISVAGQESPAGVRLPCRTAP